MVTTLSRIVDLRDLFHSAMAVFDVAAVPKAHLHQDLEKVVASIPSLNSFAKSSGIPPTAVGGWFMSSLRSLRAIDLGLIVAVIPRNVFGAPGQDLKYPPTAVGGIRKY